MLTLVPPTAQQGRTTAAQRTTAAAPGEPSWCTWLYVCFAGWEGHSLGWDGMDSPAVAQPCRNHPLSQLLAALWATRAHKAQLRPPRAMLVSRRHARGYVVAAVTWMVSVASVPSMLFPADYYQPYLGGENCLQCNHTAEPRYTSYAGDDYCMVEWVDTTCGDGESAGCFDERRAPAAACRWQRLFLGFQRLFYCCRLPQALRCNLSPAHCPTTSPCRPGVRPGLQAVPAMRCRHRTQHGHPELLRAVVRHAALRWAMLRQLGGLRAGPACDRSSIIFIISKHSSC